ncbi:hypothetical protein HYV10_01840 [Candidatus Dependentiae bacterium]|nr:hypothetical protein [Candidatus Dependentiae bacterium]
MFQYLLILIISSCTFSSTQESTKFNDHEPVHILAAIKFPVDNINPQDTFTQEIFKDIEFSFGAKGINLDSYQIEHIKKTYLYLIFLTKLEKVTNNTALQQNQTMFTALLKNTSDTLPLIPTAELLNSKEWLEVTIDREDIANSNMWQIFCKSMITDINAYLIIGIKLIHNCEKQEFNYIPHFETSYYNQDYVQIRNINAVVRIKIELEQQVQQRYLQICNDWKKFSQEKTKSISKLEAQINSFQKTTFYQKSHNMHNLMGTQSKLKANQKITHQDLLSASTIPSPLKEYVFGFFLLYELYGQLTSFMHEENLDQVLTICSSSNLYPNIFPYKPDDYVLISELLSGKNVLLDKQPNSVHPTIQTFKPEDLRDIKDWINPTRRPTDQYIKQKFPIQKSVVAQAFFSDLLSDVGHDISNGWSDIKHGVEKATDAVKDLAESVGYGIAGFTLNVFSDTDKGNVLMQESTQKLRRATHDLESSVDDFGSAIKDGIIAPVAELTGDIAGFITDDKKIGADIDTIVTSCDDALVNIAEQALNTAIVGAMYVYSLPAQVSNALIETMVAAVVSIWNQQAALNICHSILRSLVTTYMMVAQITTKDFHVIMSALGTFMNSITTLFNDLIREITVVVTTGGIGLITNIANAAGANITTFDYANKAADTAYNTLNQHRAIINQVVGVAIMIGADVLTGGAATAADAAMAAELETDAEVEAAEQAISDAENEVKEAKDAYENAPEDTKAAAKEKLNAAKNRLTKVKDENNPIIQSAKKAEKDGQGTGAKATKSTKLKPPSEDTGSIPLKQKISDKLDDALDYIKSKAKNFKNFFKGNTKAAEDAEAELNTQEGELRNMNKQHNKEESDLTTLKEKNPQDKEAIQAKEKEIKTTKEKIKTQEKDVKNTRQYARERKNIADETGKGKAVRYLKNAFSPIGMFMNIAFNFTSIIGGYNQDQKNLLQQKEQEKAIQDLWKANTESKLSTAHMDIASLDEIVEKQKASIGNQILGLSLSENYNFLNIEQLSQTIKQTLAMIYSIELHQDPNSELIPANIGTSWGFITNYLNLYPSEGFYATTAGRPNFPYSQEIAQAPKLLTQASKTKTKQWFNQRCTAIDALHKNGTKKEPNDPLSVTINLKFLYTLESELYAGIYMGGNYYDYLSQTYLAALLATTIDKLPEAYEKLNQEKEKYSFNLNLIDINETYLAKMIVLYKKSPTDPLSLGIYEHNLTSKEWILTQALTINMQLDQEHVYTIQATLNQDVLKVNLTVDDDPQTTISKTVSVTPIKNQRTYGIIASSAAIEWNQTDPTPEPQIATNIRKTPTLTLEVERNKKNKLIMQEAINQIFGGKSLTLISQHRARIFGQYIYASAQTDIVKIIPKSPVDLLIFATNTNGTITNLGKAPNSFKDSATNVLVSLITGHVFDSSWNYISTVQDIWKIYSQSDYGPFLTTLNNNITKQQKLAFSKLQYIHFKPFDLNAISLAALEDGVYLYTCNQTLTDASGKPFTDYVVLAPTITQQQSNISLGLAPTAPNATTMVSLITGNVYEKNSTLVANTLPIPIMTISSLDIATYLKQNLSNYGSIIFNQTQEYSTIKGQKQLPALNKNILPATSGASLQPNKNWFVSGETFHLKFNRPPLDFAHRQRDAAGAYPMQYNSTLKVAAK